MDLIGSIAVATKALEALKLLRDIDKSFDQAAYKSQIAQVTGDVVDLKMALAEARAEMAEKEAEIVRLKEAFGFKGETVSVRGFSYEKSQRPEGGPQGMPFCPRCEQVDGRFIRIVDTHTKNGRVDMCPQCKADYGYGHEFTYDRDRS